MKVAVASKGTVPEALVGIRFGTCSQFLIFDLDGMEYIVVSVAPLQEPAERISLEAIRAVAKQGVSAVITGHIKEMCRRTLSELGIEVIDGVEGMTVREAVERFRASRLATPESRRGSIARIAVVTSGEGLEARLDAGLGACTSFTVVDPRTKEWETVRLTENGPAYASKLNGVRAVVSSGAGVIITPQLEPACCMALQALAISAYIAPQGITVREAIERYEQGVLEEIAPAYW